MSLRTAMNLHRTRALRQPRRCRHLSTILKSTTAVAAEEEAEAAEEVAAEAAVVEAAEVAAEAAVVEAAEVAVAANDDACRM
jgi:hypothetical protein